MKRQRVIGMLGVLAASLWFTHAAVAAEAFKVGVMDQQAVMEKSTAGKRALEEMKSYSLTRQKIVNADDQELKDLELSMQDSSSKLSEAMKQEKQEQFRTKLEAYQRRLADFNREVQQKQREMVTEYAKKIAAAAQVVAQKEGFHAILDKGSDAMVRIVLYHQPALDVTDRIVKEFDSQNK
ncbi:OmpH family outer membrane protein [Nitrospira lenta]|uniref:Putative Outer membrane chaperone Skp n=1 Tax=Nitrospira lenta TaxID=1436998 RepID=A0A330L6Y1_9BACT|nr:OmpH family outer membrane protein [Nitrospira lenta]SPP65657.1 putative Outer membrane chaperone Skp [Nitrospira lenta]